MKFIRFLVVAFLSLFFLILRIESSVACAWSDPEEYDGFFIPYTFIKEDKLPFLFSMYKFYPKNNRMGEYGSEYDLAHYDSLYNVKNINVNAWQEKFPSCNRESIYEVLYTYTYADFKKTENTSSNLFMKKLYEKEAYKLYMTFAKNCEQHTYSRDEWDEKPLRDLKKIKGAFEYAVSMGDKTDDAFLKERYYYLAARLMQYCGFYEECIVLVKNKFKNDQSTLYYWAIGHLAGSYKATGDTAMANYYYGVQFARCPEKRISAFISANFNNENLDAQYLNLAKQDARNYKDLIAFRSIQRSYKDIMNVQNLEPMSSIAAIDVNDEWLQLLASRELNKLEYNFYNHWDEMNNRMSKNTEQIFKNDIAKYLELYRKIEAHPANLNKAYWQVAIAHILLIDEKYEASLTQIENVKSDNPDLQKQILITQTLAMLELYTSKNKLLDTKIYDQYNTLIHTCGASREYRQLVSVRYASLLMHTFALAAKDDLLAYVTESYSQNPSFDLRLNEQVTAAQIEKIIWALQQKNMNPQEQKLIQNYKRENGGDISSTIIDVKGTRYLAQYDFANAIKAFQELDPKVWQSETYKTYLADNPFQTHKYNDSHAPQSGHFKTYNKLEFAQEMQKLQTRADKHSANAAELERLALGYFNMSYYGNSWMYTHYYASSTETTDDIEYYNCHTAQTYFEQATQSYLKDKDRESAARCCWLAAKCEQKSFYADLSNASESSDSWEVIWDIAKKKSEYSRNMYLFIQKFQDTAEYQEARSNCSYVNNYL